MGGCIPSLLFDLRPNYGGGNEDNDLLQKVQCMQCHTQCPRQATTDPCLSHRLLDLQGKSWSVSCRVTGAHKVLFVPSKSLFPQSSVSSGGPVVGLMATSSKRAYAIPRSAAPRALPLQQSTSDPHLRRRHSYTVLAQSLLGIWVLVCTRFCLCPPSVCFPSRL